MCKLQKIRNRKAVSQGWTCYYCEQPMWKDKPAAFAAENGITLRQARLLQATAEHLTPRADGGCDSNKNIVAACAYCNIKRHKGRVELSPHAYGLKVRRQLQSGRWHGLRLRKLG